MYKLLIADDEALEREALKYIISRSIDSIQYIEEAANGREAIIKADSLKPDIIILDINMPGIDGIEAAWKIRSRNKDVIIIFLTAFHEFDYAHEAIKIGVQDYIIKPSPEMKVIDVLNKSIKKLSSEMISRQEQDNKELKLSKTTSYLKSDFTYNLATKTLTEDKFKDYLTLLDINLENFRGVMVNIDYNSYPIKISSNTQKEIIKKRCSRIIINTLKSYNIECLLNTDFNHIYVLLYTAINQSNFIDNNHISDICNVIIKNIYKEIKLTTIFGYGNVFNTPGEGLKSFITAKKMTIKTSKTDVLPIDFEIDFIQVIMNIDHKRIEELLQEMEQSLIQLNVSLEVKVRYTKELVIILYHSVAAHYKQKEDHKFIGQLEESEDITALMDAFTYIIYQLLESVTSLNQNEYRPVIQNACEFIRLNYNKDITLEEIANHSNLSPFYFSKIFKENTSQTFICFLTDIRIEEAKNLLLNSNSSIKEITRSIGYNDPNYFTRVFKKTVGCSPTDFRNKKVLITQKNATKTKNGVKK